MANTGVTTQEKRQNPELQNKQDSAVRQERRGWVQPQVNIVETGEGYLLEAEMPGVNKEGLEVLLEGAELTIIGRRTGCPEGLDCVYRESYDRDYARTFELDPTIDTGRISARMENGVLFLELPKAERVKPRKIAVE